MKHYDYLIVGQGIAGTMLSHFLIKCGKNVLVANEFNSSSASNVAAGLCNPVTGKRLVKTWKADEIFPFAKSTYLDLEKLLNKKFWHRKNILRVLNGKEETEQFNSRKSTGEFGDIIIPEISGNIDGIRWNEGFEITGAGYLDMPKLISTFRKMLQQDGNLMEDTFDVGDLVDEREGVGWKSKHFGKVIFCEGYKAMTNPLFKWLPFVPAKGEVLTIECENLQLDKILNSNIFILPLGKHMFKVGSTYRWDKLDENPTQEGKSQLVTKLNQLLKLPYTIVDHQAGIRPTVKDRKPLLGMHPSYPKIGIFNGLGAKGASLAPYFARHFTEFLEAGKPLNPEVDIRRFECTGLTN